MRKLLAVLALIPAGCFMTMTPDHEIRTGMTKQELEAGPSYHQMMGALLNDVRVWRELDRKLDEGKAVCAGIVYEENVALCVNDKQELEFYVFPDKAPDALYRVEESAYYCRKEGKYYYHYVGGTKNLNVWLGPYPLKRDPPKVEE